MDQLPPRGAYNYLMLMAVSATIFFFQLGVPPLWDRDEPRNAGCAAEMMEQGDWIVPVFNAELRTHKPVLLYWLMMASYSLFGVNEFGARFCSALLGVGTVLLTAAMGRRLFQQQVGYWAGLILASTIMFGVASRAATPDALLMFCGTLSITLFVLSTFPKNELSSPVLFPKSVLSAVWIYGAMGLGVLAKGPVGLVLPSAVIGMYLLIARLERKELPARWLPRLWWLLRAFQPMHFLRTCWSMRPFTAVVSAGSVALPWYIWVTIRTGGVWTREFLWTHNVSRATDVMEGHSGPPILFYVAAILVGFFPWSILTIPTGIHLRAASKHDDLRHCRATMLLLCWVGVYIGIFSLARTKLPSYVTPCYPALALLAGRFVYGWRTSNEFHRGWTKVAIGNLIVVGGLISIALPIAAMRFLPGSQWLGVLGLLPLVGGSLCWWFYSRVNQRAATTTLACTAVAFCVFLMAIVPIEIGRHRRYEDLFGKIGSHNGPIASFGHLEPSWIFYGGKPVVDFEVSQAEQFQRFLESHPDSLVITTPQRWYQTFGQGDVFEGIQVVHQTEYFLRDRPLVLIRPTYEDVTEVADTRRSLPLRTATVTE